MAQSIPYDRLDLFLEGANRLIVNTPEEFFRTFAIGDFQIQNVITRFEEVILANPPMGNASGGGTVYPFGDARVLKKIQSCNPPLNMMKSQLCALYQSGDLIFRIPNTITKKDSVMAPNYIIEPIISILCSRFSPYTTSFPKTYGFQYHQPSNATYIVMEKLIPFIPMAADAFFFSMFQVFHALDVAQKIGRFTHFDLHSGNIMVRPTQGTQRIYQLPDSVNYLHVTLPVDVVIIDFGLARMETDMTVLVNRIKFTNGNGSDLTDQFAFNPYYDIYSILVHSGMNHAFPAEVRAAARVLLREFFNFGPSVLTANGTVIDPVDVELLEQSRYYNQQIYYRPSPRLKHMVLKTASQMVSVTAKILANLNNAGVSIRTGIVKDPSVLNTVYYQVPRASQMSIGYNMHQVNEADVDFGPISIRHSMAPQQGALRPWNLTNNFNYPTQYVHIATLSPSDTYKFRFDCCRLDPMALLQEKPISSGIVINAGFFRINADFTPVGEYRTEDYSSNNPLNPVYAPYFGAIAKTHLGGLAIVSLDDAKQYKEFFVAGPLLVVNGARVFKRALFNILGADGNYIFRCGQAVNPAEQVPDCSAMHPGDLSHAGNLNPRTALGIMPNGTVKLFYVEGRRERGSGMDMAMLAELCEAHGVQSAINLDGGGSSQFVWRRPNSDLIEMANPSHTHIYNVGTLLSFVKT